MRHRAGCQSLRTSLLLPALGAALITTAPLALADTVSLPCVKDTSIFLSPQGDQRGNGAGVFLFCGKTGTNNGAPFTDRSLLQFDVTSIPAGSTITGARLKLRLESAAPSSGTQTCTAHKLTASWGEGAANAFGGSGATAEIGDASWTYRFFPTDTWTTPGGDYVAVASASVAITASTSFPTFSGTGMVADVQSWLTTPASNFGWIIRGNESVNKTARKFAAREISVPLSRPVLEVDFTPPPPCAADFNGAGGVTVQDIFDYLAAWFAGCTATGAPPCFRTADINSSNSITVQDVFDFLAAWFAGC